MVNLGINMEDESISPETKTVKHTGFSDDDIYHINRLSELIYRIRKRQHIAALGKNHHAQ